MIYSCTRMATVSVKGLNRRVFSSPEAVSALVYPRYQVGKIKTCPLSSSSAALRLDV